MLPWKLAVKTSVVVVQDGYQPGKHGKVREFENGQEKLEKCVVTCGVLPRVVG